MQIGSAAEKQGEARSEQQGDSRRGEKKNRWGSGHQSFREQEEMGVFGLVGKG
jgi:hypothetical protein